MALGPLVLPGLGLLVAGSLVLGGALAGGLVGVFANLGYEQEQALLLAERVEAGRYVVVVHAPADPLRAETLLQTAGAEDVQRSTRDEHRQS